MIQSSSSVLVIPNDFIPGRGTGAQGQGAVVGICLEVPDIDSPRAYVQQVVVLLRGARALALPFPWGN